MTARATSAGTSHGAEEDGAYTMLHSVGSTFYALVQFCLSHMRVARPLLTQVPRRARSLPVRGSQAARDDGFGRRM